MKHIIVIEGLDRCGKTSFLNYIRCNVNTPKVLLLHSGKPPTGVNEASHLTEYNKYLVDTVAENIKHADLILLDRFYFGMYVYGRYRNTYYDQEHKDMMEAYVSDKLDNLNDVQLSFIYFYDNVNNILSRDDGDSCGTGSAADYTIDAQNFASLFKNSKFKNMLTVDWSVTKYSEETFDYILKSLNINLEKLG